MLKANMWCPDCTCGAKGKERDFKIEVKSETDKTLTKSSCPNSKNKVTLKHMGFSTLTIGSIDASKKFAGRPHKEREKRRTDDFIKNTYPTLPMEDKRHFAKKFGMKKGKRTK